MPAALDPCLDQMFSRLSPEEIDRLRRFGTIRRYAAGDPVVTTGEVDSGMR
jgi:thioredoxin reductase (NADPH)